MAVSKRNLAAQELSVAERNRDAGGIEQILRKVNIPAAETGRTLTMKSGRPVGIDSSRLITIGSSGVGWKLKYRQKSIFRSGTVSMVAHRKSDRSFSFDRRFARFLKVLLI